MERESLNPDQRSWNELVKEFQNLARDRNDEEALVMFSTRDYTDKLLNEYQKTLSTTTFENLAKNVFSQYLAWGPKTYGSFFQYAAQIKNSLKGKVDFAPIIKREFKQIFSTENKDISLALRFKKEFGEDVDLSQEIKENETDIKQEYSSIIHQSDDFLYYALELQNEFGDIIDFTSELRAAYFNKLKQENYIRAIAIVAVLGVDIDFTHEVETVFDYYLENNNVFKARLIVQTCKQIKTQRDFQQEIEDYLADNLNFNYVLGNIKSVDQIKELFSFDAVKNDQVKHLYVIRMLVWHLDKFTEVKKYLQENNIDTAQFDRYQKDLEEFNKRFNKIGKQPIDNKKLAYVLEVEPQNIHNENNAPADQKFEIDTPITNDYEEIVYLIEKMDEIFEKIRTDLQTTFAGSSQELVTLYDSAHLNIGLPFNETEILGIEKMIEKQKDIYALLELVGLIYNSFGRTDYMIGHRYNRLIAVDKGTDGKPLQENYPAKLQDRFWCLITLLAKPVVMLVSLNKLVFI